MLNYYLLGVLELRFRGGELCRGRGDGEHDSILYRVCVYEEISNHETFFFSFVQSGFFRGKDSLRVSKIQKNCYILNPPKMASICSIVRFLHLCVFAGLTLFPLLELSLVRACA